MHYLVFGYDGEVIGAARTIHGATDLIGGRFIRRADVRAVSPSQGLEPDAVLPDDIPGVENDLATNDLCGDDTSWVLYAGDTVLDRLAASRGDGGSPLGV